MNRRIKEKERPGFAGGLWGRISVFFSGRPKRWFGMAIERGLVCAGWVPEMMDGSGKILHISDTPTCMYGYLARFLRRINPSVIIHTGDLADDIKLEIYPNEAERYRAAAKRMVDILAAPHRKLILVLGNHDKIDLLPALPSQSMICDNVTNITLYDQEFRVSHYFDHILDRPARYNLFGHSLEQPSFSDNEKRRYLNGMEMMRLIGRDSSITIFDYPRGTNTARLTRQSRRAH
jgi:predicted phosphodiesterase